MTIRKSLTALLMFASIGAAQRASAAATPASCPAISGSEPLLQPGARIILGESHGTQEIPRFVGALACAATRQGAVRVGLEIPVDEQARLDAFVASKGDDRARKALMVGSPFWSNVYQDGRPSRGMLALLESLRQLRQNGADVRVVAFDAGGSDRDSSMATHLQHDFAAAPQALFIVLVGNLHARKNAGTWKRTFMTARLVDAGVKLTTLDARYNLGSAWTCETMDPNSCGPHVTGFATSKPAAFAIVRQPSQDGAYDGMFDVGAVSFALPALVAPTAAQVAREHSLKLQLEAKSAYDAHRYEACGAAFGELAQQEPARRVEHAYNAACCYAQGGKADQAFAQLALVVDGGYAQPDEIEHDGDLVSLHEDQRWSPLVTRIRARKAGQPH